MAVEAALRRHLAIPQTRDRRHNSKLYHHLPFGALDFCAVEQENSG
jgi:hypothetical protein